MEDRTTRQADRTRGYPLESANMHGEIIHDEPRWGMHPQARPGTTRTTTARRLAPVGRSEILDGDGWESREHARRSNGDVHVAVSNGGQFYRPWKEELLISAGRTMGNFVAWPFRLVKGFFEAMVSGLAGLIWLIVKALIIPMVIIMGYNIWQASKDRPATETAQEIGRQSVGVVGSLLGGIWNGIAGNDERATPAKEEARPESRDAPTKREADRNARRSDRP